MPTSRSRFDLQPRYLANAEVFTVVYILVYWAVMVPSLLGPAFSLLGIVVSLLIGGVVVMLYLVRTPTIGAMTIMGLITGLLIGLARVWPAIPIRLMAGLVADITAASGDSRSRGRNILAYAVFSLWYTSPYVKIFYDPGAYFAHMRAGRRSVQPMDQFQAVFTPTNPIFMEVGIFVVVLLRGWLDTRMLAKHFTKAGLAQRLVSYEPGSRNHPAVTPHSHSDTQPAAPVDAAITPNPVTPPTASHSALGSTSASRENLCTITPAMLTFGTTTDRLCLDPRTKLLVTLTINILVLGCVASADLLVCFGFIAILLTTTVHWRLILGWASGFVLLLGGAWLATYTETSVSGVSGTNTAANSALDILVFAGLWMSRSVVTGGIFWYLIASTSSGQLAAALTRMQPPRAAIVPVTVMLRYASNALADLRAIFDMIRLCGVAPTWGRVLAHPGHTVEFILVPLLASSTRVADDLTAFELVRGLGERGRRTCVWPIGFGGADLVIVLVLVALVASRFVGR